MNDYSPVLPDEQLRHDTQQLVRLAIAEDLGRAVDWTTACMIDDTAAGRCDVVPRVGGTCCGLVTVPWIIEEFDADLRCDLLMGDGDRMVAGSPIVRLAGNARDLLTVERTVLNFLGRLCGIATFTRRHTEAIESTSARLFDTRKTTPGWRRLEKYAVRCGGGNNHRTGLFDGILIKDNHLALAGEGDGRPLGAGAAVVRATAMRESYTGGMAVPGIIEVEVDSIEQLRDALVAGPDIILVDNFSLGELVEAVSIRDQLNRSVELEASGNVTIDSIAEIAATGVDRISSGGLTHQATWLDLGLDWHDAAAS